MFASSLLDVIIDQDIVVQLLWNRVVHPKYLKSTSPYLQDLSESCRPRMESQRDTGDSTGHWEGPRKMSRWGFLVGSIAKG